jgi:hypothetical protein
VQKFTGQKAFTIISWGSAQIHLKREMTNGNEIWKISFYLIIALRLFIFAGL